MHHTNLDKDTLMQFGQGDRLAFKQVYTHFHDALYYFSFKLLADSEAAKDVVEETFIKLWKRHTNFETAENVKAFLFITVRNACFDQIKKTKRKEKFQHNFSLAQQENDNSEELMIQTELLNLIYQESANLPEKCKEIFKLSYLHGMENEEIAHQLDISPHTVRTQKRRAIIFLRTNLSLRGFLSLLVYLFH
jgi:RNA polymerase sigma-70 factor (family 1)